MNKKIIFGYGSLIGEESLRASAPDASNIQPAYIQGFVRNFSVWDSIGYTTTNLDLAGIPFCALDAQKTPDSEARVNGVVFSVSNQEFEQLLVRENGYNLLETTAYYYDTGEAVGTCEVFSAAKHDTSFCFDSAPQMRYLEDILQAARLYGDTYYQELLSTTWLDEKLLRDFSGLNKKISPPLVKEQ